MHFLIHASGVPNSTNDHGSLKMKAQVMDNRIFVHVCFLWVGGLSGGGGDGYRSSSRSRSSSRFPSVHRCLKGEVGLVNQGHGLGLLWCMLLQCVVIGMRLLFCEHVILFFAWWFVYAKYCKCGCRFREQFLFLSRTKFRLRHAAFFDVFPSYVRRIRTRPYSEVFQELSPAYRVGK